ncbi:MAG: hypothetical protein KFF77_00810, partial [Bacteroidetes bacterium]|nr:hypothetical protein [Bacteroidota bacterium]
MKRCLFLLVVALPLFFGTANAQITVQIGQNSPSWIIGPFYSYYPDLFFGNLVLASDMFANGAPAGGGKIRAIAYYVPYTYGPNNVIPDMQWKMGHTANTVTSGIVQSTDKEIVKTDLDYMPVAYQWNYVTFDQSFHWDGVSNLWIEACYDDPNNAYYTRKYGYASATYVYPGSNAQFQYG